MRASMCHPEAAAGAGPDVPGQPARQRACMICPGISQWRLPAAAQQASEVALRPPPRHGRLCMSV